MNKEDLLNINGGNNKKDFKKVLIYGAVVFLIFVIGVIAFAIYKNMKQSSKEESILPPQVKQEPLFKQVPIEQKVSASPKTNQENNVSNNTSQNKNNAPQENIKQVLLNKQPTPKETPKKIQKPVEKIQPKNNTLKKQIVKHSIKRIYYIQVAALLKYSKPNKAFLRLIEKYGYKYRFFSTYIKRDNKKIKVTKILIGPFTKEEARKNLAKVKKYITQNAFIFKVK